MKGDFTYIHSKYYITTSTNEDGIITYASEAFCKISGYTKKELIGQSHSIIRHPDTPVEVFENLWKTISSGHTWNGILKNKRKNGEEYWVDSVIEPIFDENGFILGYRSLRFDITNEYKLILVNNKNEENLIKFKKLFDNVNSGIAIVNKNGTFLDINPYLCNLIGYTKEEYLSMNCFDFSNNENQNEIKEIMYGISNCLIRENIIQKECRKKDGTFVWVEVTYSYFDKDAILISVKNIENLKKLEYTTNLLILQSRDAAMGEMLAMIAHQWRQPLTTLGTIVSKIKIKQDLNMYSKENYDTDFKKISSIILHLSKTIEYFRNYFKPKNLIKENISNIFEEINNIIEPLCSKNNIEMVFDNSHTNDLKIDSRVDQVMLNIYKNSIEACFEKNKKGKVLTDISVVDKKILIDISDNGGGIDLNVIDKIFEPYYSTKSKNGTGLGLYMSKNIIENTLGGKLSVKNITSGVCFTISLDMDNKNEN